MSLDKNSLAKESYYISTAINYTNGNPHIGHAYEIVIADILASYNKLIGKNVYFLTGSDEHGQKIAERAASLNMEPIEVCDYYAEKFVNLNTSLDAVPSNYIRTTSRKHITCAEDFWTKVLQNGDIYLGQYEGWYNVREERFVSETEASTDDYKDKITGKLLEKASEPSYFFRLSKYGDRIKKYIRDNPQFILPISSRNEILCRLESDELADISVSRTTVKWGIPVPNDNSHTMYVWFDALINYLSGVPIDSDIWPANFQLIGKDITWFHAVIWTAMLMSVELQLPVTIFSHGHVVDKYGIKMSKSLGNAVCPFELLTEVNSDSIRYYFSKQSKLGEDIPLNVDTIKQMADADLNKSFGNYVHRVLCLVKKYKEYLQFSRISFPYHQIDPSVFNLTDIKTELVGRMNELDLMGYVTSINILVQVLNVYLTQKQPWTLFKKEPRNQLLRYPLQHPTEELNAEDFGKNDEENLNNLGQILKTCIEGLYVSAIFYYPIIPNIINKLFTTHGWTLPESLTDVTENNVDINLLTLGDTPEVLFSWYGLKKHEKLKLKQKLNNK